MERYPIRAWRRKQRIRKWHSRIRDFYFYAGYNNNGYQKAKEFESWKDLLIVQWCQVFRNTGRPCSCELCTGERYSRLNFIRETKRIIREELFD